MVEAFIVNPETYNKEDAIRRSAAYVESFLDFNELPHVNEYILYEEKHTRSSKWAANGWYQNGVIFVNLAKSRVPTKVPGFAWSYTGFKADLTAPGILAHEIGHHVHFEIEKMIDERHRKIGRQVLNMIAKKEPAVSGYEPNSFEIFAEAMRLFILNPTLLRVARPIRYKFLTDLGLKPLHDVPWRDVLKHAHPPHHLCNGKLDQKTSLILCH